MPRADIRFINTKVKQSTADVRAQLVTFNDADDLARLIKRELDKWVKDMTELFPHINVTVNLGGRKVQVKAAVSIGVELPPSAMKKLTALQHKGRDTKPFEVEFGSKRHQYLCEARRDVLASSNMEVSTLRVEGLISSLGNLSANGRKCLADLESRPVADMEKKVCVGLLYTLRDGRATLPMSGYLVAQGLLHRIVAQGKVTYQVSVKGMKWLADNVKRLRPSLIEHWWSLLPQMMKFYSLEELNEDLVHESEAVRKMARKRLESIQRGKGNGPS